MARVSKNRTRKAPLIISGHKGSADFSWQKYFIWPFVLLITSITITSSCGVPAHAAVDRILPFSARLKGTSGDIVPDGNYQLTFKIYTTESGGTAAWTETQTISVTDGVVVTTLGNSTAFPASLTFNDGSYYLGITVESDAEMSPRKRVGAVPVAFNSDTVDGFDTSTTGAADSIPVTDSSGNLTLQGGVTVSSAILPSSNGTINIGSSTAKFGTLFVNSISASSTTISGTESEQFSINTDQATNNTESSAVQFYLGPTLNTYAALQWTGASNRFDLYSRTGSSTYADIKLAGLTATGNLDLTGNLAVNTNKFNVTASSGDTSIAGALSVTGTINGATISGGTFSGGAVSGGTISGGTVSGGTLTASAVNGLSVSGGTITSPTITGTVTGSSSPTITGFGTINGATISGGTLSAGTFSGGSVSGGSLSASAVNGLSVASGAITSPTINGTITTTGATFSGGTLTSGGAFVAQSTMDVTGLATFGRVTINGDSTALNTDITLGDASTDQLVINATLASNLVPLTDNSVDLGASNKRFANFYAANAVFDQLSTPNTISNDFVINSDNATADTEDATLQFERGSTSPNAIIGWNSTSDILYANLGWQMQGDTTLGDASGDAVTSNAATWTFANDTAVALSGGVNGLNFDSNTLSIDATNNRIGINTNAPGYSLEVKTLSDTAGDVPIAAFQARDSTGVSGRGQLVISRTASPAADSILFTSQESASSGFAWATRNSGGTVAEKMTLNGAGQLAVTATGSSAGILIGGDAQLYRSAADQLRTPDSLVVDSLLRVGTVTGTVATTPLSVRASNAAGVTSIEFINSASAQTGNETDIYLGHGPSDTGLVKLKGVSTSGVTNSEFRLSVVNSTSWNENVLVVNNTGQLQLSTTGSTGGILLGGDAQLYRSAADTFRTDDKFSIGAAALASTQLSVTPASGLHGIRIDGTNNARGLYISSTTSTNNSYGALIQAGTSTSDNALEVTSATGTAFLKVDGVGQTFLGVQGSAAGLVIGGDAQIYRSAADVLRTPDSLQVDSTLYVGSSDVPLTRPSAQVLQLTDARYQVGTTSTLGTTLAVNAYKVGDLNSAFFLWTDGKMQWGPGASSSLDTNLYRSAADTLKTDDTFIAAAALQAGSSSQFAVNSSGTITGVVGITNTAALTTSGGIASINASSNFATNINTGTSSGAVTIGGNSNTVAIDSSDWDITAAGVLTGVSGITTDGGYTQSGTTANTLTGATSFTASGTAVAITNSMTVGGTINSQTISSAANFTGTVTVATSLSTPIVTSASALSLTSGSNGAISVTPNGTGDIKLVVSGNASQDVFIGDGGTTNYTKFDTNGAVTFAGSARPYSEITLLPDDAVLPGSNNCARNQTNATNISYFTLDCDAATDESAFWQFKMPQNYANGTNIQVDIYWEANATSGAAVFDTAYVGVAEGENFDGASLTSVSGSADTTAGTAYYLNTATLTMTSPSIDANDIVNFKLIRNADTGSDDLSVDAKVIKVRLRFLTGS